VTEPVPEQPQEPAEEGRFRRGIRYTQNTALILALVVMLATIAYLIALIIRNTRHVKLDYVFGSGQARLIGLIVISAFTGWLLGLASSYLIRRRIRRPR
jgi:uncharacterized integral membrane protein